VSVCEYVFVRVYEREIVCVCECVYERVCQSVSVCVCECGERVCICM
jgi:hypothetical protein